MLEHDDSASQTPASWFGLPAPGPATGQVIDFGSGDLPPVPAPGTDGASELAGAPLRLHVEQICAFGDASRRSGERFWGRLAGTEAAAATLDYVAAKFEYAGVASLQRVSVPFTRAYHPVDWSVRLLGSAALGEQHDAELASAVPMEVDGGVDRAGGGRTITGAPNTPIETHAEGPLAYVGDGSALSVATHDVVGRVAVMVVRAAPAAFYEDTAQKVRSLLAAGALGVIAIYDLPGNMLYAGGLRPADIPCFHVGGRDGAFLLAVLEKGIRAGVSDHLRVALRVHLEAPRSLTAQALLGKIPGRTPEKCIILSAHSDSFFAGANDNATGVSLLIAFAQHYAAHRPEHDLYLYLSPGHHHSTGGMDGLPGLIPDLSERTLLALNLEHVSQAATYPSYMSRRDNGYGRLVPELMPTGWDSPGRELTVSNASPGLIGLLTASAARTMYTAPARIAQPAIAEPAALVTLGVPCVQGVETSPWFHTSGDEPSTVTVEGLQRAALFYKAIIDGVMESAS